MLLKVSLKWQTCTMDVVCKIFQEVWKVETLPSLTSPDGVTLED